MKKPIKSLLIVTPICILLVGLTILLCLLDTTFDTDKIVIAIVLSVWAFFIVPAILSICDKLGNASFKQRRPRAQLPYRNDMG